MKFPYREYLSVFPGTSDYRLILRPIITIRVVGTKSDARWMRLLTPVQMKLCFQCPLPRHLALNLISS